MKLHFVRHGESTANLGLEFSNQDSKHPLTAEGIQQTRSLAGQFKGLDAVLIFTSPVLRAAQTAGILAEHLGVTIQFSEALREWDVGIYEGTSDPQGWDLHRKVQDNWFLHAVLDSKMPGGESFLEIKARFIPFIENLIREWGHQAANLILVAHGGLYRAMLPEILTNINRRYLQRTTIPYTARIVAELGSSGLVCSSWNGKRARVNAQVRAALLSDRTIDIITTGAKSGQPRVTEIWFTNVNGRIIICGTPGAKGGSGPRSRRDWLANLKAYPDFTFCLKESLESAIPARAIEITDPQDRRRLMSAPETQWYRDQVDSLEDLVAGSPIVEVFLENADE